MSVFIRQNATHCHFGADSWVILSPIEQRIKAKIEAVGIPLKDWDISINYGIKTGFNDAFIITGAKKDELIAADPKSAEIIRPILRGRNIKRYGYDFADEWLINTHNGVKEKGIKPINIDDYPAIKKHLDGFWDKLESRADQGDTPYNLRNCAYMEDFYKQKIVYPDIMRMPQNEDALDAYPYFYYDTENFFAEATNFLMTGENIDLIFLFLSSDIGFYVFTKFYAGPQFDETGFRYKKAYLNELFVPQFDKKMAEQLRAMMPDVKDNMGTIEKLIGDFIGLSEEETIQIRKYKKKLLSVAR